MGGSGNPAKGEVYVVNSCSHGSLCRIFKSAVGIKPTASYENEGKSPDFAQNQFYLDALTMLDEVK